MSSKWLCKWCVILGGWLLSQWTPDSAMAQWDPAIARPVRSLDRWLGIGYSGGYHWRNPGPNTDYYQPYSDLNSTYSGLQAPLELSPLGDVLPVEQVAPLSQPVGARSIRSGQEPSALSGKRPGIGQQGFGWGPVGKPGPGSREANREAMREPPTKPRRR